MRVSGEKLRDNKLLLTLFPRHSRRRILAWSALDILLHPASFFNHINGDNVRTFLAFRKREIFCNVCDTKTMMVYSFPSLKNDFLSKTHKYRETLSCTNCGATMRRRTIAHALLNAVNTLTNDGKINSIEKLADSGRHIDILDTEDYSPISQRLSRLPEYITSKYLPDKEMGINLYSNVYNIDLEKITFDSERFDIIITSEVIEHVRDYKSAHREIHRCLKKGGYYIFTVPYNDNIKKHRILVDTSTNEDVFLEKPQYHGDAIRGKILAYRVFGREIHDELKNVGFEVKFHLVDNPESGIFGGDIFVCRKY